MTVVGNFDPSSQSRPPISYPRSRNYVTNGTAQLAAPSFFVGGFAQAVTRVNQNGFSGTYSMRTTPDPALGQGSGNGWRIRLNVPSSVPDGSVAYRVRFYLPPGSPYIGKDFGIRLFKNGPGPGSGFQEQFARRNAVAGWNLLQGRGKTPATLLDVDFTALPGGGHVYFTDWQITRGSTLRAWEPANGEPFYLPRQEWTVTAPGTFRGLALTKGDVLTNSASGWKIFTAASWSKADYVGTFEGYLTERPGGILGHPLGLGDWRIAVQILLPDQPDGRWGLGVWGEARWNGYRWQDITGHVAGMSWSRGSSEFAGRPETGTASISLNNHDRQFSPWNGVSAFENATTVDASGAVSPGYFSPGTLMRIVTYSPTGQTRPIIDPDTLDAASSNGYVPCFTGVVESWSDRTVGNSATSEAEISLVETLSLVARVNERERTPVGNNDLPAQRVQRLVDEASWQLGEVVNEFAYVDPANTANSLASPLATYGLQSTSMAQNRAGELYLTADSVGGVVRSRRDGRLVIYNTPSIRTRPLGYADGPDRADFAGLGHTAELAGTKFTVPFVADSVGIANDDEIIENVISLAYAGGTQRTSTDVVSVRQYGAITYTRSDLICKSDDLLQMLASRRRIERARKPLRLTSMQLHSLHDYSLAALIGLDVHDTVDVNLPPLPTHAVVARKCVIDSMSHTVMPINDGRVLWDCDYTFGTQSSISNNPL